MLDILYDNEWDLDIADGDFITGESTIQHQQLLIIARKGDFKENPAICVGAELWLKDEQPNTLLAEVKRQFEKDGMVVQSLALSKTGKLEAHAHY